MLRNRVVWVKDVAQGRIGEWLDFLSGWHPCDVSDGVFVVENRESSRAGIRDVAEVDYRDCVDENSVRLFCWSMLMSAEFEHLGLPWREYGVALLSHLCGHDVEVAASLARSFDIISEDPIEAIIRLSELPQFALRGTPGSHHALLLARQGMTTFLRARIRSAQIETLFPIIEENRANIIDQLGEQLEDLIETRPH